MNLYGIYVLSCHMGNSKNILSTISIDLSLSNNLVVDLIKVSWALSESFNLA